MFPYLFRPQVTVSTYYSVPLTMDVSPSYEGRASMTVDLAKRESTLRLSKVTLQDSREFQCRVQIPMDDGGKPAAITSLLVLGEEMRFFYPLLQTGYSVEASFTHTRTVCVSFVLFD